MFSQILGPAWKVETPVETNQSSHLEARKEAVVLTLSFIILYLVSFHPLHTANTQPTHSHPLSPIAYLFFLSTQINNPSIDDEPG